MIQIVVKLILNLVMVGALALLFMGYFKLAKRFAILSPDRKLGGYLVTTFCICGVIFAIGAPFAFPGMYEWLSHTPQWFKNIDTLGINQ